MPALFAAYTEDVCPVLDPDSLSPRLAAVPTTDEGLHAMACIGWDTEELHRRKARRSI